MKHKTTVYFLNIFFCYSCSTITNVARCTSEFISRIAIEKAVLSKKKNLLNDKFDLNLKEEISSVLQLGAFSYGVETEILRKVDQKYLKILKCGAGEARRR